MSDITPEIWTTRGLLDQICELDKRMEDRAFAFIIGAGASVTSGIDSGRTLVERWLGELKQRLDHNGDDSLETWATAENLGIKDFSYANAATFYPQVFERRFRNHQDEGYAYLEEVMEGNEPSIGYSVLAKILAETRHKVVITTNFDNLVADALATYTQTHPLVAGHESLTSFVRTRPRRPLVAKIHRDLFLAPINDDGVEELKDGWEEALKRLFAHYTPIVIGYGGNDGSLMNLLEEVEKDSIPGGIYWCHRKGADVDDRIKRVVTKHHGKLIPIIGFDEFMLELGNRFGYPPLADELKQKGKSRVSRYQKQFEEIIKRINAPEDGSEDEESVELKEAVSATVERQKDWWGWQLRINETKDNGKKEGTYRQSLVALPNSPELTGNFANFMRNIRKDYDEAERLYRKALELDPSDAHSTGNFASFMGNIRKNYDEAEPLYRKALELDPSDANHTGNFASFMRNIRKDYDEAERLHRKALELDPSHANNTGNFALFMKNIRKDYDQAERLYRKALELDPSDANISANFAEFLMLQGQNAEAEKYALRVCDSEHEPSQAVAEGLLYLGLLALIDGRNDVSVISRLKGILVAGFERGSWDFEPVFKAVADSIQEKDLDFYRLFGAAILDEADLPKLEQTERWKMLE